MNLGYAQIVLEVDDLDESYESCVTCSAASRADFRLAAPPETWDLGPVVGTRRNLVVYDWMGIRYQYVEAVPTNPAWDHSLPPLVCPT